MTSFTNFHTLDPEAYRVTMELHDRAEREQSFMSFVFRWMAFNGWMAAVTGEERDFEMIGALAAEPRMIAAYDALMNSDVEFRQRVEEFTLHWPVLSVSSVRAKLGFGAFRRLDRAALIAACAAANVRIQPAGWAAGIPTWEQLLRVIYQIRCNLFHGEKSERSVRDRTLIESANTILAMLVARSGCYGWHDQ
ncbi:hypothetical protein IGS74_18005 [Aureimonas sp. OT7]|uniref:hypothetical protein n=1 Tax=Aureimonas sp. OT7 TaxID=2816454 RepID=UPI001785C3C4|nr:hypothetical protein [Aureimonas sp. OT7]QOG06396.1 hypothetical protein IGS74_18005 [Aureimonas sp. OT7]